MILSFKLYVLSNLTLSFSLSHKQLFCVVPSATELNYPFKNIGFESNLHKIVQNKICGMYHCDQSEISFNIEIRTSCMNYTWIVNNYRITP